MEDDKEPPLDFVLSPHFMQEKKVKNVTSPKKMAKAKAVKSGKKNSNLKNLKLGPSEAQKKISSDNLTRKGMLLN